jgi:C4-dicarboxylate-specific signal transduction histidine kinase
LRIFQPQPIRRQVFAATLAVIVPVAIAAFWSASRTRSERDSEVLDQAGSVAVSAGAYLNQYLNGLDSMASALVRHPAVMALNGPQCTSLVSSVLHDQPLILNIVVTDTSGHFTCSAVPSPAEQVVSPEALPYVHQVVTTGKPVVSELITGRLSGKPTVVLAYPVRDGANEIAGVLALGLNVGNLQVLFNAIPLPPGSVITLSDERGRVLARSRDADRFIGRSAEPQPQAPRDVARERRRVGLDGIERFFGNSPVDRGPWLLSVGIPTSVAEARVSATFRRNMGIGAVEMTAILIMALLLSSNLTNGVNRLRFAVQRIADGDLSPPAAVTLPNRELQQLHGSFTTMAANLRETHTALDHQIEQERKMRETLQSLQRQVVRQERLAAVGVLVSGVAHELNNPLQAILGTAELLERSAALTPETIDEIAFIKTQSGRAREIIRNLSRFSSQQPGPPTLVDLRDVIAEVVQLRGRNLENSNISLDVKIATDRKVYANFTEIEQVTLNFVINAQQSIESAGPTKGRILIRVADAGKRVRLEVQDDGPGVTTEDEPKLFQPFFTTKPVGKGTGLGLSVSYGIIESYSGSIGFRPNEWGGATFFFELPVTEPKPPSSSAARKTSASS